MNFEIVKIDNVAYDESFNPLVYESIREKSCNNNNMLILYLLNKRSQFIAVQ